MKVRKYRRLFSSLLALTMVFTLLFPMYGAAAAPKTKTAGASDPAAQQMKALIAQQEASQSQENILHPDLANLTGDEEVSVIVGLSEYPAALVQGINKAAGKTTSNSEVTAVQQKVTTQQQKFKNSLSSKGIKAKYGFSYNYAFNGMALKVKASELKALAATDGVTFVEPDVEMVAMGKPTPGDVMKPAMNTSSPFLKVPDVWAKGYEGQGVKVAVLDTGIDYLHPEFQGVYKGGLNFIDQSNTANYTKNRAADDPYETTPSERPAGKAEFDSQGSSFYTEHGTHVSGTIAAQGKNPFGIKGLAPKVDLYVYRVLGAYGSGANSGIIAAIDKAAQNKMDIINLSLGSSSNTQTSSDAIAINNAALAGVTAVVATGNDGPNRGTIGSPSTAAFAISVANSTVPETTRAGKVNVSLDGGTPTSYSLNMMGWKFGQDPASVLTGTYDVVAVPNWGVDDGTTNDYAGLDVNGKVALVSRGGGIAFVDKIAAAKKNGAVAVIIHNFSTGTNAPGPSGVFLSDDFKFIPAYDMSYTDGNALRSAMTTKKATVTFSEFTSSATAGDDINSSSSRGPANPVFDLKPDVSAPGTNIMSSVPRYGREVPNADYSEAYERFTGTSMATPHVAGVAALLKSMHPDWTPFDIKVAISNTAKQLDVTKYDVFSQGPGRVQPLNAVQTQALAYVKDTTSFSGKTYDNVKGTITFGNVTASTANTVTVTRDITVKNLTGNASDYTVTVQTTKAATGTLAGTTVTVDKSNFTLAADGTAALKVSLNVPKGSNSAGNEILGYVKITNGTTNLNLPFAANLATATGLKSYSIDSKVISPNGDSKLDSTTVRYEFYDRQNTTYMELWDAAHQDAGEYQDGYLGYLVAASSTTTGAKTKVFNGTYTDWGTGKSTKAADGVYTIDLTTLNSAGDAVVTFNWLGPIYVKTTAPTINAAAATTNKSSFNFSGSVQDKYIDWKSLVNEVFEEDYDVNSKLTSTYQLTNANGVAGTATPFTLGQDGSFSLALDGLTDGNNKVKITVTDNAFNTKTQEFTITKTQSPDADATPGKGKLLLNNNPMAKIKFAIYQNGAEGKVWYDFTTDENGEFTHNLADGTYNIEGIWAAPTWYPLNNSFTIKDGLVNGLSTLVIRAENFQVPADPSNNLTGTLTKNGEGYANIPFAFHTADGQTWFDTRTDAAGKFAVSVPDGSYQIDGIWDGNLGKWYVLNQKFTVQNGKLVGSESLAVSITALEKVTFSGKLTKAGTPLANLQFALHTTAGETVWYDATTDANGNFSFVLPDGTYKIEGFWVASENTWYETPMEFTVNGSLVQNIDIPAAPPRNVTGTLTKGTAPLSGIQFAFHNPDSTQWYDVWSTQDGSFGIQVPDGEYQIDGVWVPSESKWYVLNLKFTVQGGHLVGTDKLTINLAN